MLELTFGEQVKIVLNRKGMTIKQLAEMIEERTGKKMSRQNLTQRLSRDNFQEQDMRLIASILECPFYLSIMEENADSEYTSQDKKRKDTNIDIMDAEPEQLTLNLEYEEPEPEQKEQPKKVAEDTAGHERDITIGELVDIHEELDQMEQTGEPAEEEPEYEGQAYEEEPEYEGQAYEEEPGYESAEYTEESGYGVESEYAEQSEDEENDPYTEEPEYESAEYTEEPEYGVESEYAEQSEYEEEPQYTEPEDVNQILEEVAAMEEEDRKEKEEREKEREKEQEKPRGWRAYFPRRKKKQSESVHEDKPEYAAEQPEYAVNQEQSEEQSGENITEEQYQNPEEQYQNPEGQYQDPEQYRDPEQYQDSEQYQEADREYEEYVQENEQEMEDEFADTAQDWEEPADDNAGEINPYTGLEYESNSVRMHPKRIGYVQVYDRSDHQWTDMTEWAFLGYQERKKALLGKDYEPPIYLD